MTAAERLIRWRVRVGLTQTELAAQLGKSRATVCNWEAGRWRPDDASRRAIEILTGGAVRADDWLSDHERAEASRLRGLRPIA